MILLHHSKIWAAKVKLCERKKIKKLQEKSPMLWKTEEHPLPLSPQFPHWSPLSYSYVSHTTPEQSQESHDVGLSSQTVQTQKNRKGITTQIPAIGKKTPHTPNYHFTSPSSAFLNTHTTDLIVQDLPLGPYPKWFVFTDTSKPNTKHQTLRNYFQSTCFTLATHVLKQKQSSWKKLSLLYLHKK